MKGPAFRLESLELLGQGLDHPEGICATSDGQIFIGGEAGQLYRLETDNTVTEILSTGGFMLGLAADGEGRIYAIDMAPRCVWRIDPVRATKEVWAAGSETRKFKTPNWGLFDAAGAYYLSDSGDWGASNGCVWRIPPGGEPEVWTDSVPNFPNGMALSADDSKLLVLESYPGALVEVSIKPDGSAGERRELCAMDDTVPDGVALTVDGAVYIACYRPDAVYRWHPDEGLSLTAEDPRGTVLAAPTNIVFVGADHDQILVPNIGRWHLTKIPVGVRGIPLHYPTQEQLGG